MSEISWSAVAINTQWWSKVVTVTLTADHLIDGNYERLNIGRAVVFL